MRSACLTSRWKFRQHVCLAFRPLGRRSFSSTQKIFQSTSPLIRDVKDNVLTLTLNRPKQRNALNFEVLRALEMELSSLASSPRSVDIRAVVLQGDGPHFCSGHDLRELQDLLQAKRYQEIHELFNVCSRVMMMLGRIPQPTICAVIGMATAAGCQLVASCDLAVGSQDSKFCTPGVHLGLFCHTPGVALARAIGARRAKSMLLTGRVINAEQALDYGLLTDVIPSLNTEDVAHPGAFHAQKAADEMAVRIASDVSFATLSSGKKTLGLHAYQENDPSRSIEQAYRIASDSMVRDLMEVADAGYGISAFLAKDVDRRWQHK